MNFTTGLILIISSICFTPSYGQNKTVDGNFIEAEELEEFLKHQLDTLNIPGLSIAVINDSKVIYNQTFGVINNSTLEKVGNKTLFEAASMSKSVFAYFVMKMVEKGLLNLDTPLYHYLPYPDIEDDERYKLITARMVLSHTSGFPNWRFQNPDKKLDIKFEPGTRFSYSGEGYEYLAKVVAHINDRSLKDLDDLFQEEVARPLGMKHSYFTKNDYLVMHKAKGHSAGEVVNELYENDLTDFGAAHSLHTNAEDFSRFMIAIMEEQGLKKNSFDEMLEEQVILPENSNLRKSFGFNSWGLGFVRAFTPYGIKYAHGGMNPYFQGYFMIIKDQKFGFVFFANSDNGLALLGPLEQFLMGGKQRNK